MVIRQTARGAAPITGVHLRRSNDDGNDESHSPLGYGRGHGCSDQLYKKRATCHYPSLAPPALSIDLTLTVTLSILYSKTMDKLSGLASKFGGGSSSSSSDPNQQAGNANNEDYLDKGKLGEHSCFSSYACSLIPLSPG